jgi:nicotinate-nucleotide adenylyltransferase
MRIALFGGTFDPVHYGHLRLAEEAREAAGLERVLFVPAHMSPFRQQEPLSESRHRLLMTRLAVADNPPSKRPISRFSAGASPIRWTP